MTSDNPFDDLLAALSGWLSAATRLDVPPAVRAVIAGEARSFEALRARTPWDRSGDGLALLLEDGEAARQRVMAALRASGAAPPPALPG